MLEPQGNTQAFAARIGLLEARLRTALALDLQYSERAVLKSGIDAAVLILFAFSKKDGAPEQVLITRRTEKVETHKGQIAFPGGVCDPLDEGSRITAALRETEEEVGILRHKVRVVGELPVLATVTGFSITPVVGILEVAAEEIDLSLSDHEIAEAAWIPVTELLRPGTYSQETREWGEVRYPIHVYQVGSFRIWGATAAMLKNLLERLSTVK